MKKEILAFIFDGYDDWESAYICSMLNAPETEYADNMQFFKGTC
ncbi:hypothetical protein [Clostridium yunnanense]|nr:hypothetical protein [Clostridium yunnanense]